MPSIEHWFNTDNPSQYLTSDESLKPPFPPSPKFNVVSNGYRTHQKKRFNIDLGGGGRRTKKQQHRFGGRGIDEKNNSDSILIQHWFGGKGGIDEKDIWKSEVKYWRGMFARNEIIFMLCYLVQQMQPRIFRILLLWMLFIAVIVFQVLV